MYDPGYQHAHKPPRPAGVALGYAAGAAGLVIAVVAVLWGGGIIPGAGTTPGSVPAPAAPIVAVTPTPSPTALVVSGAITITDEKCNRRGLDGYSDIHEGAQVLVKDASGEIVAVGELLDGSADPLMASPNCRYAFTVAGVPTGLAYYQVSISHRGGLTYTEEELRVPLALSLGD